MLTFPKKAKINETPNSTFWFDADGILISISKKAPQPTLEESKLLLEELKKSIDDKKTCMLINVTHISETSREIRDYAVEKFSKFVKAIARVSNSAVGKMLANLFFTIKTQPYPTKMFNNEKGDKNWLQQFL
ncbi:MAG: hypothetical protein H0W73_12985 [Bacteroidetes bacterium]|nr:hypothetical protein [Bacteroidota bacterium]